MSMEAFSPPSRVLVIGHSHVGSELSRLTPQVQAAVMILKLAW